MLNLSEEAAAALAERLRAEGVIWITTVTPGGQPQSSPVRFAWEEDEFLVYAQPRSWKVRNIRVNPQVSLHLNSDTASGQLQEELRQHQLRQRQRQHRRVLLRAR